MDPEVAGDEPLLVPLPVTFVCLTVKNELLLLSPPPIVELPIWLTELFRMLLLMMLGPSRISRGPPLLLRLL